MPGLVTVIDRGTGSPTCTSTTPNASAVGETVMPAIGGSPFPMKSSATLDGVDSPSSSVTVRVSARAPAACGVKVATMLRVPPAATRNAVAAGSKVQSAVLPLSASDALSSSLPLFCTRMVKVVGDATPTAELPKSSGSGEAGTTVTTMAGATPVPDSDTVKLSSTGGADWIRKSTVSVAVCGPLVCGAKRTTTAAVAPGAIVLPSGQEPTVKSEAGAMAQVSNSTGSVPLLVRMIRPSSTGVVVPTRTSPNASAAGSASTCAVANDGEARTASATTTAAGPPPARIRIEYLLGAILT